MLKDWECMTDLLLEDPLNPEDGKYCSEIFEKKIKKLILFHSFSS